MARGSIVTRTLEDGTKRYDTVIRVYGKQRWKTFMKKKDAEDYLDRHSTDIRDCTFREIKKATFAEYAEHWKSTYMVVPKLKPSTINGYGSILDKHLVPEFGPSPLQAIDSSKITSFEARLLQKAGITPTTVRNVLTLLGRIFTNARKERYLRVSPMIDVDKTKVEKAKKGRALKPGEVQKVLEACDRDLRLMVLTALLGGLRRSEVFALHWTGEPNETRSFVDFENDVIRVRKAVFWLHGKHQQKAEEGPSFTYTAPKSKASVRDVPLSPALKRELQEFYLRAKDKTGLIFQTANGTPMDPNNVCRWQKPTKKGKVTMPVHPLKPAATFTLAVERAAIGPVRFHDLRHTYGSLKLDQGAHIYDVQRWMGHSSIQVTIDVYGHPVTDRGQEAAAKTDDFLFGKKAVAAAD